MTLAQNNIEYANSYKCLGFVLDDHLSYDLHIKDLSKKLNYGISILRRIKPYVPTVSEKLIANSIIISHLEYCTPLLHNLNKGQMDLLLKLQKRCARTVLSCSNHTHSKPLFISLNWLPFHQIIELQTTVLMCKIKHAMCPQYLQEMFVSSSTVHTHRTRSVSSDAMYIKRGASNNFIKTFAYYGAKTWNSLPCALKDSQSLEIFKNSFKSFLMDKIKMDSSHYGWIL